MRKIFQDESLPKALPMRVVFDATDLVHYLVAHSAPSGIQRVQIDVYRKLRERPAIEVTPVFFSERRWVPVDLERVIGRDQAYIRRNVKKHKGVLPRLRRSINKRFGTKFGQGGAGEVFEFEFRPADKVFLAGAGYLIPRRRESILKSQEARGLELYWMVYDLIPVVHPDYFTQEVAEQYEAWIDVAIAHPGKFLCISHFTRDVLADYAQQQGRTVSAIATPLAQEFTTEHPPTMRTTYEHLAEQRFVLSVGTLEIRKNHIELVEFWQRLLKENPDETPTLVLVGRWGWHVNRLRQILRRTDNLAGRVIHFEDASDDELAWLYQHCEFTIFPSKCEGWGLPIGESLWMGKHCICYEVASHREAGGNYATYCDACVEGSLGQAIRRGLAGEWSERIPARADLRTWRMVTDDIAIELTR
jgi:glycosyltransferase involved in cell wall biosynthesis